MVVIEFDMQIKIYMNQTNGTLVVHEFFNRYFPVVLAYLFIQVFLFFLKQI